MRPGEGVEVDEHVVTCAQVAPRLDVSSLEETRPDVVELLGKLVHIRVVRAAIDLDGKVAFGELEARHTLQIDITLRLGQQLLTHEHHRAILEGGDARPLERRVLGEAFIHLGRRRRLQVRHPPLAGPLGHCFLNLPLVHPIVGHNLGNHCLRKLAMHLAVGQQQSDLLAAHDRPGQLLDTISLLKVDGHREDEYATRVVNLLGAAARHQILDVEEDAQARADLATALLDELAYVLAKRPSI
eukprot:4369653-Prymnesium_polylepis.1